MFRYGDQRRGREAWRGGEEGGREGGKREESFGLLFLSRQKRMSPTSSPSQQKVLLESRRRKERGKERRKEGRKERLSIRAAFLPSLPGPSGVT